MSTLEEKTKHEILQGQRLAEEGNPELIWNWDTPAGRIRARRRGTLLGAAAGLRPGMQVLEVGCGTGLFTAIMAERGAHILAIDLSPHLLEFARVKNLPTDLVQFREMRFEDSLDAGPYDAIVGSSILHHLDIPQALRAMYHLLRPDGVIAFAEPNMLNPQVWAERHIAPIRNRAHVTPHETAIVRWNTARLLKQIGYSDISIRNFDWLHPATPQRLIGFASKLGKLVEHIPAMQEFSGSVLIRAARPADEN